MMEAIAVTGYKNIAEAGSINLNEDDLANAGVFTTSRRFLLTYLTWET